MKNDQEVLKQLEQDIRAKPSRMQPIDENTPVDCVDGREQGVVKSMPGGTCNIAWLVMIAMAITLDNVDDTYFKKYMPQDFITQLFKKSGVKFSIHGDSHGRVQHEGDLEARLNVNCGCGACDTCRQKIKAIIDNFGLDYDAKITPEDVEQLKIIMQTGLEENVATLEANKLQGSHGEQAFVIVNDPHFTLQNQYNGHQVFVYDTEAEKEISEKFITTGLQIIKEAGFKLSEEDVRKNYAGIHTAFMKELIKKLGINRLPVVQIDTDHKPKLIGHLSEELVIKPV